MATAPGRHYFRNHLKTKMVRPTGFEPMTYSSGGYRSIQLSYGRTIREIWGERRGLNPRPQEPQSCALPTELRPPYRENYGPPERARTSDLRIRSPLLYPAELQAEVSSDEVINGRGERI